jgi:hypothetical protein
MKYVVLSDGEAVSAFFRWGRVSRDGHAPRTVPPYDQLTDSLNTAPRLPLNATIEAGGGGKDTLLAT